MNPAPYINGLYALESVLEFEDHGQCELGAYRYTVVLTGLPLGHPLHYSYGFTVKVLVDTTGDSNL